MHFARAALEMDGDCAMKHMPLAAPYRHNYGLPAGIQYDEACVRCNLDEAIKNCERKGWVGLEWKATPKKSRKAAKEKS